jgi:hypothetical protein
MPVAKGFLPVNVCCTATPHAPHAPFSGNVWQVFKAAAALGGAIIFIDELDALGGSRCVIHGMDGLVTARFRN